MSHVAIHVESLGKRYRIGGRERYLTMRDRLANVLKAPARWLNLAGAGSSDGGPRHIWALRNVSFDLQEGEVLGLIGRNGAGKTTLLKILSRVTQPTEGWAEIRGRIASLLEVGTGFHPELTGRENTYLNGAILGMGRSEIKRKFDEIVAFAEIEKFIDTPVKYYSSGMYVRLAFAVAAHLEPEILVLDEVLAVGDAKFQEKCVGTLRDVTREGRTVLFVSHNMAAIQGLCSKCYLLSSGQLIAEGSPRSVVERYLADASVATRAQLGQRKDRQGNGEIQFLEVAILDAKGRPIDEALSGQDIAIA